MPIVQFFAVIGRTIRHHQYLRAGFCQRLNDVIMPGVLADRGADAHAANAVRANNRPFVKLAFFVKNRHVWQVEFGDLSADFAALQDEIAVVKLAIPRQRTADANRRPIGEILCKLLNMALAIGDKRRFAIKILRLITGDEHFRQGQHIGLGGLGAGKG